MNDQGDVHEEVVRTVLEEARLYDESLVRLPPQHGQQPTTL